MQSAEPLARTRTIESPQPAKAVASPWGGIPVAKKMRRCKIGADYARIENVHPCPSDSRGDALLINHVRVLNDVSIHAPPNSRGDACFSLDLRRNHVEFQSTPLELEGRCDYRCGEKGSNSGFNPRPRIRGEMRWRTGLLHLYTNRFNPRPPNSRGDAAHDELFGTLYVVSIHAPRIRGAML